MSDLLPRLVDAELQDAMQNHPAVMVVGPRATGKTTSAATLAASLLPLGNPSVRAAVNADPLTALQSHTEPILVDEWQLVPETLNAIKLLIDNEPNRGRFLVTGSVRGDLDSPTWPGTGRLVRIPMFGLVEREIEGSLKTSQWLETLLRGEIPPAVQTALNVRDYLERAFRSGFPEAVVNLAGRSQQRWLTSYVDQLVSRDALDVDGGRDPQRLRRYLEAFALNSAGIVDDVTLYEAARISKKTAKAYEKLLENLFVIDQIPAWTPNNLKRLSLAPKRYLVDPGLFTGVLGVATSDAMLNGELLGRVIDTFVTSQLRAELGVHVPRPRLFHLRTEGGQRELDLVIELGYRKLIAIEIKASSSPSAQDAKHLRWFVNEFGDDVRAAVLFHTGPNQFMIDERIIAAPIAALWS